jgi:hypothetical protein
MAPVDRAKNSLKTAQVIRNLGGTQIFRDRVGSADRDDLYRLQIGSFSSLDLVATAKSSNLTFQLFSLKQPPKALQTIGRTAFSDLSRQQIRKYVTPLAASRVNAQPVNLRLEAGTYYLRVAQAQGNSRYRLSLSLIPNSIPTLTLLLNPSLPVASPIPAPNPSAAPNPSPSPSSPPSFSLPSFQPQIWVRQFGTAQNDYAFGTALGGNSVYVAGVTSSGNAFSGSGLVAQYLEDGASIGQRSLSTANSTATADIVADDSGNYYVVGASIEGTNSDAFIAKYNSTGQQQWTKTISSSILGFSLADAASGVFIDDANNVYVTGIRRGAPSPFSQGKAFIAKYASNGSPVTAFGESGIVEFGNARTTAASGITVANGRVSITGITDAALNLSNGSVNLTGGEAFVASFDQATGTLIWNQTLSSGSSTDYGRGIAASGSDLYIVGQTAGALPSGSLATNSYGGGESDAFLAKYVVSGSSGSLQWAKQIGGNGLDAAQAIAIDPTGKIYLTGETNTSLFGTALGGSDAWIAQADASGNLLSASQIGTAQNDEAYSLATSSTGAIYLAGQTQGSFPAASPNQGNYDIWLAKYGT